MDLLLWRHADAEDGDDAPVDDLKRKLTPRGERQASRIALWLHRQMPDGLRRLHPRFRTPWIGIIVFSGFAILVTLPGQATFLGAVYSFGALLSFFGYRH